MKIVSVSVLFVCISFNSAFACEDRQLLDNEQVRSLIATIKDASSDPLDQVFAFENLMCASRQTVRDHAMRVALKASSKALSGRVLSEVLMSSELLRLAFPIDDSMGRSQIAFSKTTPSFTMNNAKFYRTDNKIEYINQGELSINGTKVDILHYDIGSGTFFLEDGRLKGLFRPKKADFQVPAIVNLLG